MGFFVEREDSTNGRVIKTGDNVKVKETNEKGFVIAILNDEYMISVMVMLEITMKMKLNGLMHKGSKEIYEQ